jgi:hypothetical protein
MSLAISAFAPEPLYTRSAYRKHMARAAKAFSAISLGAAFVLTTGEAGAQSSRASAEEGFAPLNGTPVGFNDDGDLIVLMADGSETIIPRGEYGLVGDQIMVSDMIEGVEVAQNGYIPPTSGVPVYGSTGPFGLGYAGWLIPLGLAAAGVLAYIYFTRSTNEAPTFDATSYTEDFDEDDTGTVVTVSATDAESDAITYSISGADAAYFTIDSTSGAISFDDDPNFEAPGDTDRNNDYVFTAVATDEHGEASTVSVTVNVDDVADAPSTTSNVTFTGSGSSEDLANDAAVTDISMLGGNDSAILSGGIAASGSVDMGAGADYLQILTLGAGSNVTIDLGSDEDELELDVDLGANVVTIDLGSGSDVLDIDVAQTATHIVENFGTGDVLDLATFNITGALDTQLYATSAEATSAITAAAGGTSIALHENGSDIDVYIDTDDDGTVDMSITIDSVSSLTSGQFEL